LRKALLIGRRLELSTTALVQFGQACFPHFSETTEPGLILLMS